MSGVQKEIAVAVLNFALTNCADLKAYFLNLLRNMSQTLSGMISALAPFIEDADRCVQHYCSPTDRCYNAQACRDWDAFARKLHREDTYLHDLQNRLDALRTRVNAIDCSTATNLDLVPIKQEIMEFNSLVDFVCGPLELQWLLYEGATLHDAYSRRCFPKGTPDPYIKITRDNPDCVISKRSLITRLYGHGQLVSRINATLVSYNILKVQVEAAIQAYSDEDPPRDCLRAYSLSLTLLVAAWIAFGDGFPTLAQNIADAINAVDCSAIGWEFYLANCEAAINALDDRYTAFAQSVYSISNSITEQLLTCPVPPA